MDDTKTWHPEGLYKIELCRLPLRHRLFLSCNCHGVTDRTCKQKSWLKCACFLYKIHVTLQCSLQVRSVTPWQLHDRKSRCRRGRRHSSILYSPSGFFSSYYVFPCVMSSYHPFYFDFHSIHIIFDVSFGFLLWNVNRTTTWHLWKMLKFASVSSFVYKYDQWPHDSYMTGRVGVGEADDIAQFYIALLDGMCFRVSCLRIIHFILISTAYTLFLTCPSVSFYGT
jgi:hypothetical protein